MTKTVEINLEPVKSSITGDLISVGDEVIYITICMKTTHIQRGKFLGRRVTTHRRKRYSWEAHSGTGDITWTEERFTIQRPDGSKANTNYARMIPITANITALEGARL